MKLSVASARLDSINTRLQQFQPISIDEAAAKKREDLKTFVNAEAAADGVDENLKEGLKNTLEKMVEYVDLSEEDIARYSRMIDSGAPAEVGAILGNQKFIYLLMVTTSHKYSASTDQSRCTRGHPSSLSSRTSKAANCAPTKVTANDRRYPRPRQGCPEHACSDYNLSTGRS
jgi:hypothetical protein